MSSRLSARLRLLALVPLALVISGCFLFSEPPITYNVHVAWLPPDDTISYFCYGLDVTADFGVNRLLDISVDQTDNDGFATGKEAKASGSQPYYPGMPLEVEVICRDETGSEIGGRTYVGKLLSPSQDADLTLWNFAHPEIDLASCIEPAQDSGGRVCGLARGFEF